MGRRHRVGDYRKGGKPDRIAEQRRIRHQVHQDLATAADYDDLALSVPKQKGGWVFPTSEPAPNEVPAERRRVRHWKQAWWKRRARLRAERLALEDTNPTD